MPAPLLIPQFTSLVDYLDHYAATTPEADAVWHEGSTMSYRLLAHRVAELARSLAGLGVSRGDRVAVLSTPRPEYLVSLLAAFRVGAVWVGLNPKYTVTELRHVISNARPTIILSLDAVAGRAYGTDIAELAREVGARCYRIGPATAPPGSLPQLPEPAGGSAAGGSAAAPTANFPSLHPTDPATIVYTSGSSGAPKGAVLSHGGLVYASRAEAEVLGIARPRVPCNLPINHVACIADLTGTTLAAGGMLAFIEEFSPEGLLALIPRLGLTNLMTVPTVLQLIAATPGFGDTSLDSVQRVVWGGAPLPVDTVRKYRERGIELMAVYGMTETIASIAYTRVGADDQTLADTVGEFDPGMAVRLHGEDGAPVATGEQGEVQVRHAGLFLEYFNNADATVDAFTGDGWFKTGDVGTLDHGGALRLIGRMSDMIKSGGYNVYPREIELRLEARADIALAAVIGRPDPTFGEVGVAYVVPAPGHDPTPAELQGYARTHLANYKVPKEFVVVEALPLLPVGKVDKQTLRRRAQQLQQQP